MKRRKLRLKCHRPDVFAASLINSQPMGFYSTEAIIRDARKHGIPIGSGKRA